MLPNSVVSDGFRPVSASSPDMLDQSAAGLHSFCCRLVSDEFPIFFGNTRPGGRRTIKVVTSRHSQMRELRTQSGGRP